MNSTPTYLKIPSTEGVALSVRTVGGQAEAKTTIVAIHGGPGHSHHYMTCLEALAGPSVRVVTYDQRGMSGTATPETASFGISGQLSDLESIRTAFDLDSIVLLGHSWGGFIAMRYAMTYPEWVSHLVLLNSMPASSAELRTGFAARAKRQAMLVDRGVIPSEVPADFCDRLKVIAPVFFADPTIELPESWHQTACDATVHRKTWDQAVGGSYDFVSELGAVSLPVTVVSGEADFLGGNVAESLAAAFPNASLKILPDCGHFVMLENSRAAFIHLRDRLGLPTE